MGQYMHSLYCCVCRHVHEEVPICCILTGGHTYAGEQCIRAAEQAGHVIKVTLAHVGV